MKFLILYLSLYSVYYVNVSDSVVFQKGYMTPHLRSLLEEGLHNYKQRQFFAPSKFEVVSKAHNK